MITCHYVTAPDGSQVHYRQSGSGPALFILHPSPQSSDAMLPAIAAFADVCTCIALDTPGYGLSDALNGENAAIEDYGDKVADVATALGYPEFYVYGAATGAQIGIALAKRHPQRVKRLLLDVAGHFDDSERARMLDGYFPDVTPQRDGSHLLTFWDMVRHLMVAFPWNSQRAVDQLEMDEPPVQVLQQILLRYLRAGSHYAGAYRVAFHAEQHKFLDGLTVPSSLVRTANSMVLPYTDELIKRGLPDSMCVLEASAAIGDRYAVQRDFLVAALAAEPPLQRSSLVTNAASDRFKRDYWSVGSTQWHIVRNECHEGEPIVVIHDGGASAQAVMTFIHGIDSEVPIIAVDLPGHGATSVSEENAAYGIDEYGRLLAVALEQNTRVPAHCIGFGLGGAIALSASAHTSLACVSVVDAMPLTHAEQESWQQMGIPDFSPRHSGAHLPEIWAYVEDRNRYWPWFDRRSTCRRPHQALPLETHNQQALDLLYAADVLPAIEMAAAQAHWPTLLAAAACPVVLAVSYVHPEPQRVAKLANDSIALVELGADETQYWARLRR